MIRLRRSGLRVPYQKKGEAIGDAGRDDWAFSFSSSQASKRSFTSFLSLVFKCISQRSQLNIPNGWPCYQRAYISRTVAIALGDQSWVSSRSSTGGDQMSPSDILLTDGYFSYSVALQHNSMDIGGGIIMSPRFYEPPMQTSIWQTVNATAGLAG
ncbi:hypothetical protein TgHK011_003425 [Trichoderma gracile]|nr:hypothetical protein TgHK011_003425 [Trichoderma gracile]